MSQRTLARLWSVIGVSLVYLSLNAWSVSQQWQISLPGDPFRDGKFTAHGITLIAIPLGSALLIAMALLTMVYAHRTKAPNWAARLPRFSDVAIDPSSTEGRLAQAVSLTTFLVLPLAAQIHFIFKFLAGTAYRGDVRLWSGTDHLRTYVRLADALSGRYSYDRLDAIGPTFVPFWEPWLFVLLLVTVLVTMTVSLAAVFVSRKKKRPR